MQLFHSQRPSKQLIWLLLGVLLGFIISLCAQILLIFHWSSDPTSTSVMMTAQAITQVLTFLLPALLIVWMDGHEHRPVRKSSPVPSTLLGVLSLLLLLPCIDIITQWNQSWPLPHSAAMDASEEMLKGWLLRDSSSALMENLLVIALLPAVCEEFFFRRALQHILHRWWGKDILAVFVTALVFSLAHGDLFGLVPRFLLGLILGLLFLRTGHLTVNISVHFVNNALVVIFYWFYARGAIATNPAESGITLPWLLTILSTLMGVALLVITCRHPKFANSARTTA